METHGATIRSSKPLLGGFEKVLRTCVVAVTLAVGVSSRAQLLNTSFETAGAGGIYTAANWIQFGAVNRETWAAHDGSYGMAFEWWVGPSGGFYQDIAANPGQTYTLKAWCLDDAASVTTGVYSLKFEYYDNSMTLLGADSTNISSRLNNVWQRLTLNGTPCPTNCATLRVLFGGSVLINDEVLKVDSLTITSTPAPSASIATNQFSGDLQKNRLLASAASVRR